MKTRLRLAPQMEQTCLTGEATVGPTGMKEQYARLLPICGRIGASYILNKGNLR